MIASRRGLAVLTAIAALLALLVALGGAPSAVMGGRQLVPGLSAEAVRAIALRRPSRSLELARGEGGWRVIAPAPGPADEAAVADLLSAIAVARRDRSVPMSAATASGLASPRLVVELTVAGGAERRVRLAIGDLLAATAQVWVRVDDGDAALVPAWLATALDRELPAVRQSRLAPISADQVSGVEVHGRGADLVLAGQPPQLRGDGWSAPADPARVRDLVAAIAALAAIDFPTAPPAAPSPSPSPSPSRDGLAVHIVGGAIPVELVERGPCPAAGSVYVDGSAGAVCVDEAAWAAVAARAAGPTRAWIDPRPIDPARVATLTWSRTGVTVRATAGDAVLVTPAGERRADEAAVRAAIAALAAPATVVAAAVAPAAPVVEVIAGDGGRVTLSTVRIPDGPAVRRGGEPFALVLAAPAAAALALDELDLRDRALIDEEPSGLAQLAVDAGGRHVAIARGATLGEWQAPAGIAPAAIEAAAEILARLRAERFLPAAALGAVRARLEARFDAAPVAGAQPGDHVVEIGAARPGGCAARVDGAVAALAASACDALLALAR